MNLNSNHSNLAFNREIENCRKWLQTRIIDASGYSSEALLDRLVQRITEIGHYPYALAVSILCKKSGNCFPVHGTKLDCNRLFLEMGSGRVTIGPKQWLSNQLDFFLHWAFCLIAILAIRKSSGNSLPAVLVFGVGEDALFKDGNDEQFIDYCRSGPIAPLRDGKRFFIQSSSKNVSSSNPRVTYSRSPLIGLLRDTKLGVRGRLRLLVKHLILCFEYARAIFRFPQLSLIGMDFAYSRISSELDTRKLIDSIVLTCSGYTRQPLWIRVLRQSKVHMVWYAQNWRPLAYSADQVVADLPQLRWIRVDTHWVWTHAFGDYLKRLGHDKAIEVVGPIVWYLPETTTPASDAIEIAIFDTPACPDETALRYGGDIINYYHPNNLNAFIKDITSLKRAIEEVFHLPVLFRLKTKRGYNPLYDRGYFDHLESLNSLGTLTLAHPSTNIYSLITGSSLVICYPFSTTAYVAEALNAPVIYYDPTGTVLRQDFADSPSSIKFANSPEDLLNSVIAELRKIFSDSARIH